MRIIGFLLSLFVMLVVSPAQGYANQKVKKLAGFGETASKACAQAEQMADVYRPRNTKLVSLQGCDCFMVEGYWACTRKAIYEQEQVAIDHSSCTVWTGDSLLNNCSSPVVVGRCAFEKGDPYQCSEPFQYDTLGSREGAQSNALRLGWLLEKGVSVIYWTCVEGQWRDCKTSIASGSLDHTKRLID